MAKPKNDLRPEAASRWLMKGKEEHSSAVLNLKSGGYPDTICFLAHQAGEKTLKGFLVLHGIKFRKEHSLAYLLKLCARVDEDFLKLKENCQILDPYYIETRYPLDIPITYSKKQVEQAVELAQGIVEFVEKKVRAAKES
jgi:HEPN domain-containing protein